MDFCCSADLNTKFTAVKWYHFALFTFSSILIWVLRDYADDILDWVPEMDSCKRSADKAEQFGENACFGKGAVLRVSFALCVFHLGHALMLIACKHPDDPRVLFHTECMSIKTAAWFGLVVLAFFIPDTFYQTYGEVARVLSGLFLVFQALVIINVVYTVNESMLDREECICPLISGAVFSYALSLAFIIVAFEFYAPRGSCSTNVFWITWTIIMGLLVTVVSISKWRVENAGLFTSGVILAYCCFLLLSALNNQPEDGECIKHGGIRSGWIKVVSFFLAIGAVLASTMSVGTAEISESEGELPYRPDYFHLVFGLAAMYISMLFTNWDLEEVSGEFDIDSGWRSAWIKIGSQWFVFLLYLWTLIAPKILKDREF